MIWNRFFIWGGALGLLLLIAAIGGFYALKSFTLKQLGPSNEIQYLYIKPGTGLLSVSAEAERLGLVEKSWHLSFGARFLGVERSLKAGEYVISPSSSVEDILTKMVTGETHIRRIAVPEGYSVRELEFLLETSFGIDTSSYELPAEGSILPETYFYQRGEAADTIIARMKKAMDVAVAEAWEKRGKDLPLNSPYEAITLASIVEKETAVAEERGLVAAVFNNRLKRGMRLQSDPTIIYGVTGGLPLGRPIRRSELREETPYNTYRIDGLPPTPIANPGIDSIKAVLNPAEVSYLYFVADGTGGHAFANTLEEHNANVKKWREFQASAKRENQSSQ